MWVEVLGRPHPVFHSSFEICWVSAEVTSWTWKAVPESFGGWEDRVQLDVCSGLRDERPVWSTLDGVVACCQCILSSSNVDLQGYSLLCTL